MANRKSDAAEKKMYRLWCPAKSTSKLLLYLSTVFKMYACVTSCPPYPPKRNCIPFLKQDYIRKLYAIGTCNIFIHLKHRTNPKRFNLQHFGKILSQLTFISEFPRNVLKLFYLMNLIATSIISVHSFFPFQAELPINNWLLKT